MYASCVAQNSFHASQSCPICIKLRPSKAVQPGTATYACQSVPSVPPTPTTPQILHPVLCSEFSLGDLSLYGTKRHVQRYGAWCRSVQRLHHAQQCTPPSRTHAQRSATAAHPLCSCASGCRSSLTATGASCQLVRRRAPLLMRWPPLRPRRLVQQSTWACWVESRTHNKLSRSPCPLLPVKSIHNKYATACSSCHSNKRAACPVWPRHMLCYPRTASYPTRLGLVHVPMRHAPLHRTKSTSRGHGSLQRTSRSTAEPSHMRISMPVRPRLCASRVPAVRSRSSHHSRDAPHVWRHVAQPHRCEDVGLVPVGGGHGRYAWGQRVGIGRSTCLLCGA